MQEPDVFHLTVYVSLVRSLNICWIKTSSNLLRVNGPLPSIWFLRKLLVTGDPVETIELSTV